MTVWVLTGPFPERVAPTLCLLRRRVRLSREVVDDVVRARGLQYQCIWREKHFQFDHSRVDDDLYTIGEEID